MLNLRVHIITALTILTILLPQSSFAQSTPCPSQSQSTPGSFVSLACYGNNNLISNTFGSGSLSAYFNALFTLAISAGAIAAVLRLAYAGYMYMGAADMWGNKQKAKEIMGNAIVGLLLLLSIWLILRQINPDILSLKVLQGNYSEPSATQSGGGGQTPQAPQAPTQDTPVTLVPGAGDPGSPGSGD